MTWRRCLNPQHCLCWASVWLAWPLASAAAGRRYDDSSTLQTSCPHPRSNVTPGIESTALTAHAFVLAVIERGLQAMQSGTTASDRVRGPLRRSSSLIQYQPYPASYELVREPPPWPSGVLLDPILDNVSASRKMSTKPAQAQRPRSVRTSPLRQRRATVARGQKRHIPQR